MDLYIPSRHSGARQAGVLVVPLFLRYLVAADGCAGCADELPKAMDEPGAAQPLDTVAYVAGQVDRSRDLVFGPRAGVVRRDEKPEDRPLQAGDLLGLCCLSLALVCVCMGRLPFRATVPGWPQSVAGTIGL